MYRHQGVRVLREQCEVWRSFDGAKGLLPSLPSDS